MSHYIQKRYDLIKQLEKLYRSDEYLDESPFMAVKIAALEKQLDKLDSSDMAPREKRWENLTDIKKEIDGEKDHSRQPAS